MLRVYQAELRVRALQAFDNLISFFLSLHRSGVLLEEQCSNMIAEAEKRNAEG